MVRRRRTQILLDYIGDDNSNYDDLGDEAERDISGFPLNFVVQVKEGVKITPPAFSRLAG